MTAVRLTGLPGDVGTFAVPSRSVAGRTYRVIWGALGLWCPCAGYGFRGDCRHARAVVEAAECEASPEERRERARRRLKEIEEEFSA